MKVSCFSQTCWLVLRARRSPPGVGPEKSHPADLDGAAVPCCPAGSTPGAGGELSGLRNISGQSRGNQEKEVEALSQRLSCAEVS